MGALRWTTRPMQRWRVCIWGATTSETVELLHWLSLTRRNLEPCLFGIVRTESVLLVWICKTVSVVKLSRSSELLENRAGVSSVDPCAVKHSLMRDVNCAVGCQFVHFLFVVFSGKTGGHMRCTAFYDTRLKPLHERSEVCGRRSQCVGKAVASL